MRELRQLTPQEVMFVGGEMRNVYHHTAGLVVLDGGGNSDFGFEAFKRHTHARIEHIPQFRWKLHEVPLGLDLPYWVEDENFRPESHIRRIAVPAPGDREALAGLVSFLYSRHMDRDRPLWEFWFIEGLADGQFAVLYKVHHCLMDGESAAKLFEYMWDFEPGAGPRDLDPAIADATPGAVPEWWQLSFNAARQLSGLPVRAGREMFDTLERQIRKRMSGSAAAKEKPAPPTTRFNADIGSDRGFVFGSMSLADVKAVKDHFHATVNDVVLALVGSSMRDYLQAQGELPEQSLRGAIPVSLRGEGDDKISNNVTVAAVTLGTDLADPVERLRQISEETGKVKKDAQGSEQGIVKVIQLLPPLLVNALVRMTPAEQVAKLTGINLIVSNVRGGTEPMFIGDARIVALYPMSIINPGGGINITCGSLAGDLHFGITVDPQLVPEPWLIMDGLQKSLDDYRAFVSGSQRRKKTAARSGAGKKKRATARKKTAAKRSSRGSKRPTARSRPS